MVIVQELRDCTALKFTLLAEPAGVVSQEVGIASAINLDPFTQIVSAVDVFVLNFPLLRPFGDLSGTGDLPLRAAPILRIYKATISHFNAPSSGEAPQEEVVAPLLLELGPSTVPFEALNEREQLYLRALACLDRKEVRAAFDTYVELLRRYPTDLCAMMLLLHLCQAGAASWREVLAVYRYAQHRAGWDEERLPSALLLMRTLALTNAGLAEEALKHYERLVAQNADVVQSSCAVASIVKTFHADGAATGVSSSWSACLAELLAADPVQPQWKGETVRFSIASSFAVAGC